MNWTVTKQHQPLDLRVTVNLKDLRLFWKRHFDLTSRVFTSTYMMMTLLLSNDTTCNVAGLWHVWKTFWSEVRHEGATTGQS